ncbi:Imm1 family immunity protein [Lentzea sp. BCCO 10_0798]|uniref:Imm1 family immunity protein n=1 Tax=Lentzea kristufekii TaxID=3095430 RepID=A0ABU4U5Q3_9PSEU|nr:Imm1 family immunity protein [Lentzea sp. BCCO 10_0798]MDX8055908.1 Imm1 family immunity protein [Lentzea sp. BCCO 10_0798]
MSYTLDIWYYHGENRADEPEAVRTASELDRVLAYLVDHAQPHPTQIAARELPRFGVLEIPDRMFKLDVDKGFAALHYVGPDPDGGTDQFGFWVTQAVEPTDDAPTLYVDKDNKTEFPRDSVILLEQVRDALLEFQRTGSRPTCVRWQVTDATY